ncbi:MAG: hypothetical protein AB8W37_04950 [Arsenophonus endosymbiont of Dermacentor nuttalli]
MTITIRKMEKTDHGSMGFCAQLWHRHDHDVHVSAIDNILNNQ